MSTTLTVNWEQLALVVGDDGDPGDEEMQELFHLFLEDAGMRLRKIADPGTGLDRSAIAKEAHKVRGAAASFGFDQLAGVLTTIEVEMEQHSQERLDALVQEAVRSFDNSVHEVREKHPELFN